MTTAQKIRIAQVAQARFRRKKRRLRSRLRELGVHVLDGEDVVVASDNTGQAAVYSFGRDLPLGPPDDSTGWVEDYWKIVHEEWEKRS